MWYFKFIPTTNVQEVTSGTCGIETELNGPEGAFQHSFITMAEIMKHLWWKLRRSISERAKKWEVFHKEILAKTVMLIQVFCLAHSSFIRL